MLGSLGTVVKAVPGGGADLGCVEQGIRARSSLRAAQEYTFM